MSTHSENGQHQPAEEEEVVLIVVVTIIASSRAEAVAVLKRLEEHQNVVRFTLLSELD